MCGGSLFYRHLRGVAVGLSPRVRGKPVSMADANCAGGSIPACAGEAAIERGQVEQQKVYPRVCGGSDASSANDATRAGLSPRVRGKRRWRRSEWRPPGSIPACAGEAAGYDMDMRHYSVYPRVCGGSTGRNLVMNRNTGLSPRVRGKRRRRGRRTPGAGSIPACAGEACRRRTPAGSAGVYPRVCGGSASISS